MASGWNGTKSSIPLAYVVVKPSVETAELTTWGAADKEGATGSSAAADPSAANAQPVQTTNRRLETSNARTFNFTLLQLLLNNEFRITDSH